MNEIFVISLFLSSLYKLYREKKEQECEAFLGFAGFFTLIIQCSSQAFVTLLVFPFLWEYANTLRRGGGNMFTCLRHCHTFCVLSIESC